MFARTQQNGRSSWDDWREKKTEALFPKPRPEAIVCNEADYDFVRLLLDDPDIAKHDRIAVILQEQSVWLFAFGVPPRRAVWQF